MLENNAIKISSIWSHNIQESVIFLILKKISKKKIIFSKPHNADILFIGPYNNGTLLGKTINKLKKNNLVNNLLPNLEFLNLKRKYNPLKIYFSEEGYLDNYDFEDSFHITTLLGINNANHLRFPIWKDFIDWSDKGFKRENNFLNGKRFGKLYSINKLMRPQGNDFMKKENKICFITSHLNYPRNIFYKKLKNINQVDGFGKFFDKRIKNHNSSNLKKIDILKNYRFNLCPHNILLPGYYDEKIPDSFYAKTIPITWCDKNVKEDFNINCMINLNDYMNDDFKELIELINSNENLKKFGDEPLILKEPNLEKEFNFLNSILEKL
jgi:hypothetical protein